MDQKCRAAGCDNRAWQDGRCWCHHPTLGKRGGRSSTLTPWSIPSVSAATQQPPGVLSEEEVVELVGQMKGGDMEARNRLVESRYPSLMRIAGQIAELYRWPDRREDLFQVGCLGLLEGLPKIQFQPPNRGTFLNYSASVLRNAMIDLVRKTKIQEEREVFLDLMEDEDGNLTDPFDLIPDPSVDLWGDVVRKEILDELTPSQRKVVEWVEQGYTQEEIARKLGLRDRSGVSHHLRAVREKVRGS